MQRLTLACACLVLLPFVVYGYPWQDGKFIFSYIPLLPVPKAFVITNWIPALPHHVQSGCRSIVCLPPKTLE